MIKANGLSVLRIPINGKETLRIMKNGQQLWSGTGLPAGYTLLEYIESTGQQYIDTRFVPNQDTRVVMDVNMTSSSNSQFLFGTRTASSTSNFSFLIASALFRSDYGESKLNLSSPTTLTNRMKVDKNKNVLYIDGISKVTNSTSTFTCQYPLFICASPDGNVSSPKYFSSMRIYYCQIYDNDKLVRDYIPCMNPNGICGLFDKANRVFYPSASSTPFTGDYFNYAEFIESNGSQYIDTGFKPNQNTRIILDYENVGSSFVGLCGSQSGTNTNSFLFYINSTTVYPQYGTHSLSTYQININTKTRLIYDLSSLGIKVGNNNLPVNVSSFSSGYNIALFSINIGRSIDSRMSTGKIYSCKIYDNGVLVRDFVPVKGIVTGTFGLYDKVNKVFYGSASSTPFTGA